MVHTPGLHPHPPPLLHLMMMIIIAWTVLEPSAACLIISVEVFLLVEVLVESK